MKILRITVTQEDIAKARKSFPCPIKRALLRATDWLPRNFLVDHSSLIFASRCVRWPRSVSSFIRRFDSEKFVKPFHFTLKLP